MKTDLEKLLGGREPSVDATRGLQRFRTRVETEGITPARLSYFGLRGIAPGTTWVKGLAAAAAVVLVATTLGLSGAADSFLKIFEPQRFEAIPISSGDLTGLPDLSAYGTLTWSAQPRPHAVADARAAAAETGFPLLEPATLPRTITGAGQWAVIPRTTATFRFSAAAATAAAARIGRTPPPMPAGMDGSAVRVDGGPAAIELWGQLPADGTTPAAASLPQLAIAQAKVPVVSGDGVSFDQLRGYLLAQPGISPRLAAQIRAIGDPTTTAIVPIPADLATARHTTLRGADALVVSDPSGFGTVVVWRTGGVVFWVVGSLSESEVLSIAASLH